MTEGTQNTVEAFPTTFIAEEPLLPQFALKLSLEDAEDVFNGEKRLLVYEKPLNKSTEQPYYVIVGDSIVGVVKLGHGFTFDDVDEFNLAKSLHRTEKWIPRMRGYRIVESSMFDLPLQVRLGPADENADVLEVEKMTGVVETNVWKSVTEERVVAAAVLVPGRTDLHEEIYDAETVRAAAYYFMENYLQDEDHGIDVMHNNEVVPDAIRVLQSFVLDEERTYSVEVPALDDDSETKKSSEITFPAGTWIMYARVISDTLWENVKDGALTGWSIAGLARVRELRKLLKAA
jgi:hypothetical protein